MNFAERNFHLIMWPNHLSCSRSITFIIGYVSSSFHMYTFLFLSWSFLLPIIVFHIHVRTGKYTNVNCNGIFFPINVFVNTMTHSFCTYYHGLYFYVLISIITKHYFQIFKVFHLFSRFSLLYGLRIPFVSNVHLHIILGISYCNFWCFV